MAVFCRQRPTRFGKRGNVLLDVKIHTEGHYFHVGNCRGCGWHHAIVEKIKIAKFLSWHVGYWFAKIYACENFLPYSDFTHPPTHPPTHSLTHSSSPTKPTTHPTHTHPSTPYPFTHSPTNPTHPLIHQRLTATELGDNIYTAKMGMARPRLFLYIPVLF